MDGGNEGGKQPYFIRLPARRLFAFAGLWEHWCHGERAIESCTLITTEANPAMKLIHRRMPVILAAANYGRWLGEEDGDLEGLLQPYGGREGSEALEMCPVSTYVNTPKHNDALCMQAL